MGIDGDMKGFLSGDGTNSGGDSESHESDAILLDYARAGRPDHVLGCAYNELLMNNRVIFNLLLVRLMLALGSISLWFMRLLMFFCMSDFVGMIVALATLIVLFWLISIKFIVVALINIRVIYKTLGRNMVYFRYLAAFYLMCWFFVPAILIFNARLLRRVRRELKGRGLDWTGTKIPQPILDGLVPKVCQDTETAR